MFGGVEVLCWAVDLICYHLADANTFGFPSKLHGKQRIIYNDLEDSCFMTMPGRKCKKGRSHNGYGGRCLSDRETVFWNHDGGNRLVGLEVFESRLKVTRVKAQDFRLVG